MSSATWTRSQVELFVYRLHERVHARVFAYILLSWIRLPSSRPSGAEVPLRRLRPVPPALWRRLLPFTAGPLDSHADGRLFAVCRPRS